jgi:hypothetical protein
MRGRDAAEAARWAGDAAQRGMQEDERERRGGNLRIARATPRLFAFNAKTGEEEIQCAGATK